LDQALLTFTNQTIAHPALDIVALMLTIIGFALLPGVGVALLAGPHRRAGAAILTALCLAVVVAVVLQYMVLRPRPEAARLIQARPTFPSYPSGHAAAAFSTAIIIGLYFKGVRTGLLALSGAALISLSRVYLGHHYPSDVLAGAVVGLAIGAACFGLMVRRSVIRSNLHWLLWPQIALAFLASHMAYLGILPFYMVNWPYADKVMHFLLFGLIMFWLNLWLQGRAIRVCRQPLPLALVVLVAVVSVDEASQVLSPLRSLSLADLLSNLLGLVTFWWLSQQFLARKEASPETENAYPS
jgi:undecaprenyl-diphosphatase